MKIQTVYWRRRHGFPAEVISDVSVVRAEDWDEPPLVRDETHDQCWGRIDIDLDEGEDAAADIWGPLGLCGDTTSLALIKDGVAVSAAIMARLGLRPPMPEDMVYDCPWSPSAVDDGGTDDEPSADYVELQVHCARVYEQLREALAEKHGIDITPLEAEVVVRNPREKR